MVLPRISILFLSLIVTALRLRTGFSSTNGQDLAALQAIQKAWAPTSFSWSGDPCETRWLGVTCDSSNANVIKLQLPSQSIVGTLPPEIGSLINLQTLDLSYNGNLTGTLPSELFKLTNLQQLFLQACGLFGTIPDDLGKLVKLTYLAVNQNFFTGTIPSAVGQLSEIYWLDFSYNQFSGGLPLELSKLTKAQHFHLHVNKFSGNIPDGIFNASQPLVHLLLYNNSFEGPIPSDIGDLPNLDILRLDFNKFSGVPESFKELVTVTSLQLDHNSITGDFVNVSSLSRLQYLNLGSNQFNSGPLPSWLQSLQNLTSLDIENGGLQGPLPASIFALPNIEYVNLGYNHLNGTLDLSKASSTLTEVDVQQNNFTGLAGSFSKTLNMQGNDICVTNTNLASTVCGVEQSAPNVASGPVSSCGCSGGLSSNPTADAGACLCSYPVSGLLIFTALKVPLDGATISVLQAGFNKSIPLLSSTTQVFLEAMPPTAALSIYPDKKQYWDANDASTILSLISTKVALFPSVGPYYFIPSGPYLPPVATKSGLNAAAKIGIALAVVVFFLATILVAVYAFRQRQRAEKAELISKPFASWISKQNDNVSAPKVKGARLFNVAEMKKVTNNFSQAQEIGAGGYGKVYKATLPTGEQVAIKRSQASSQQGAAEFKNEIELLSRLHHKNLVELIGFCFEEQMLIYEYIPNGTLRDALSGRSNVVMDWPRRLQAALDSARGLAYLHYEANPTIIHRDVKSANILLDEKLTAKVADFGLSKLGPDDDDEEAGHVSTQVKGTLGYLDPEYYTTRRLSDRSDVYSFGIVLLELMTSRQPIEHGRFIVREVRSALQRGGLTTVRESLVDLKIDKSCPDSQLKPFLELALHCVEESAALRPSMKQVTKELEAIIGDSEVNNNMHLDDYVTDYKKGQESEEPLFDSSAFQYSGAYATSQSVEPK